MRIVAIINQKGGCGKTTTAINLAGVLSRTGLRTLLVDMDPQSHCAAGLGVPEQRIDLDIGDALLALGVRHLDPSRLLWRVARDLDLAPSRMKLAGLEASRGGLADKPDKERRLGGVLAQFAGDYDVALIDCSPAIGLLTFNALTAASCVLIPVETGFFSLQGAAKQVHTVTTVGKRLGVEVPLWLLPTIHDANGTLARDLLAEMRRRFAERVTPVVIRRDDRLREAASYGQPIIEYAPDSEGAADYTGLGEWMTRTLGLRRGASSGEGPRAAVIEPWPVCEPADVPGRVHTLSPDGAEAELSRRVLGIQGDRVRVPGPAPAGVAARESLEGALPASRAEDVAQRAARISRREGPFAAHPSGTAAVAEPEGAHSPSRSSVLVLDTSARAEESAPAAKPAPVERLAGARPTSQGVLFVQPVSVGHDVSVAGDFNAWTAGVHRLKRNDALGVYELCVRLAPGRHLYRLVVDGHWSADPFNDEFELNPFGEPNSVVRVPPG